MSGRLIPGDARPSLSWFCEVDVGLDRVFFSFLLTLSFFLVFWGSAFRSFPEVATQLIILISEMYGSLGYFFLSLFCISEGCRPI